MGDGDSAEAAELRRGFETLEVVQPDGSVPVWHIRLNRPGERNALPLSFFLRDLPRALALLRLLPSPPLALVLSALGPHFCAGLHLPALAAAADADDPAAAAAAIRRRVLAMQEAISGLERFPTPVVAAVQGGCVGAGVDLAAACDLRFCEEAAFFAVKEVDLALAADLGTLQRLPGIVGYGNAADLALTGRRVSAAEAKAMGLVSRVFPTRLALDQGVGDVARGGCISRPPLRLKKKKEKKKKKELK